MAYFETESGVAVNEYLYSPTGAMFDSATVADGSVSADSDGDRILQKGTVLASITSGTDSGKVGPYDTGASDGRQTAGNIVGISERFLNLRNGDFEVAYLYAGVVNEDRVWSDGVMGSLSDAVKTAMQSNTMHVLFR